MKIGIITPAPPNSLHGNRVTASRWQQILRGLRHRVTLAQDYENEPFDLLLALHAHRSYAAIARFHERRREAPILVALTGTDLYLDLPRSRKARASLDLASRLIVLQPKALEKLRPRWAKKARVIYQSVEANSPERAAAAKFTASGGTFDVCVAGHLRAVKDPFRPAAASRWLPWASRVRILHFGRAMSPAFESRARAEMRMNPRYHWLGERPRRDFLEWLRRSRLFIHPSRLEGGANVIGEAIVAGIPILASRIAGNVGLLGENYPGYFKAGDRGALAKLMWRAETDPGFLAGLKSHGLKLAPLFDPSREQIAWAKLLHELGVEMIKHNGRVVSRASSRI